MAIEPTDEIREAFARAMEADDGTADGGERALFAGLAAVLAIVERDYVTRWGYVSVTLPNEMLDRCMDFAKDEARCMAEAMQATVVDIDRPERDRLYAIGLDQTILKWKVRRND